MSVVKRLRVHGRVQGVGYRYSMLAEASRHGVSGWVRNRRDGTVEAVVAGSADAVERIVEWARSGPPGAAVTQLEVEDAEGGFEGFESLPTA